MKEHTEPISTEDLLRSAEWLQRLARSLVRDEHLAEDLVQQTWLAAIGKGPRQGDAHRGWLATVLRNLVYRHTHDRQLREHREANSEVPKPIPSTADLVCRFSRQRMIADEVARLAEPYRATILLHYFEGLSLAEIARRQDLSQSTVRARLKRAHAKLRSRLDRLHDGSRAAWIPLLTGLGASASKNTATFSWTALCISAFKIGVIWMSRKVVLSSIAAILIFIGLVPLLSDQDRADELNARKQSEPAQASSRPVVRRSGEINGIEKADILGAPQTQAVARVAQGTVLSPEGLPIAGAHVTSFPSESSEIILTGDERRRQVQTDAEGRFSLPLIAGSELFVLIAETEKLSAAMLTRVRVGDDVVLQMEPADTISGRVMDFQSRPIVAAKVTWMAVLENGEIERHAVSDEAGRYCLEGLPSGKMAERVPDLSRQIQVDAPGFAPISVGVYGRRPRHSEQDLYLSRGAEITGKVLEVGTKAPIEGAEVEFWVFQQRGYNTVRQRFGAEYRYARSRRTLGRTVSDASGTFHFNMVPTWGVHAQGMRSLSVLTRTLGKIVVRSKAHAIRKISVDLPTEGEQVSIEVQCHPAAEVRGRVCDQNGTPIVGARVAGRPESKSLEGWFSTMTDDEGNYILKGIAAKRNDATLISMSAQRPQSLEGNNQDPVLVKVRAGTSVRAEDIVLGSLSVLEVTVTDTEGQPIKDAKILTSGVSKRVDARSDSLGQASFHLLPSSLKKLTVTKAGFAPFHGEVEPIISGRKQTVNVVLETAAFLKGKIVYADQTPVSRAVVRVYRSNSKEGGSQDRGQLMSVIHTSMSGDFVCLSLPPGRYEAVAESGSGSTKLSVIKDVALPTAADLLLELPGFAPTLSSVPPQIVLEGSLRDAATGLPILKANVGMQNKDYFLSAQIIAPGRFRFTTEKPGVWKMRIQCPGYSDHEDQEFELRADRTVDLVLERGVRIVGRVVAPGGHRFRDAKLFLSGFPAVAVAADGSFELRGALPGKRYRATVFDMKSSKAWHTFVSPVGEECAVPEGTSEVHLLVPVAPAGGCDFRFSGRLLFEGHAALGKTLPLASKTRLEVETAKGKRVMTRESISGNGYSLSLPYGKYRARLLLPGHPPVVAEFTIMSSDIKTVNLVANE